MNDVSQRDADGAVMLIPSLEPDHRLPAYIDRLREAGFENVKEIGGIEWYQGELET